MPRYPILKALLAQVAGFGLAHLCGVALAAAQVQPPFLVFWLLQGSLAAGCGFFLGLSRWWVPINFAFVPLLAGVSALGLPPWAFLAGFVLTALFYWNSFAGGVPLYLTGNETLERVGGLVKELNRPVQFIDLGCGFGGNLHRLSKQFPESQFHGVETAPMVFVVAWVRCVFCGNCRIRYQSLWAQDLSRYDVVYCFLSPVPMPELWQKARKEMRKGTLLVSNTFEVPGVPAHQIIEMHDWRSSKILVWKF